MDAGPDFESRALALERNFEILDLRYLEGVLPGLRDHPWPANIDNFGERLANELEERGLAGLFAPKTAWIGPLPEIGGALGRRLRMVEGTPTERLIQAMLDTVEDASNHEAELGEASLHMREVAFSPRRMLGRAVRYVVREGDDIRTVAAQLHGSPDFWPRVVEDYDLRPPYVGDGPGTLQPGMRLVAGESSIPSGEVGALGETVMLRAEADGATQDWDIVEAEFGGVRVIGGVEALVTDCALRLATPLGDLPEHPRYGMPEVAGLPRGEREMAEYVLASETLMDDTRVASVSMRPVAGGVKLGSAVTVVPVQPGGVSFPRRA